MRPFLALALATLPGCGMSEPRFQVDGITALCERIAECTGHVEVAACIDEVRSVDRSGCDYDEKAAKDCVAELDAAACTTHPGTGGAALEIPGVCDEVYPGCAPLYEAPYEPIF